MAITQRVKEGKWYKVYNRRKRLVGSWHIEAHRNSNGIVTGRGFLYKGYVYDKDMNIILDFTGDNGIYLTAIEAAEAAIENIIHP